MLQPLPFPPAVRVCPCPPWHDGAGAVGESGADGAAPIVGVVLVSSIIGP